MTADFIDDELKKKIREESSLFIPKPVELEDVRAFIKSCSEREEDRGDDLCCSREESSIESETKEKRSCARSSCSKKIHCAVTVYYNWELKSELEADIIDVSSDGVGLVVKMPLYSGNVLRFNGAIENRSGIVKWSRKDVKYYRAGIKLI
jgi:hypothetical protein